MSGELENDEQCTVALKNVPITDIFRGTFFEMKEVVMLFFYSCVVSEITQLKVIQCSENKLWVE